MHWLVDYIDGVPRPMAASPSLIKVLRDLALRYPMNVVLSKGTTRKGLELEDVILVRRDEDSPFGAIITVVKNRDCTGEGRQMGAKAV